MIKLEEELKPGVNVLSFHYKSVRYLGMELIKLNFFNCDIETLIELKIMNYFYPHYVSHFLGLDVHDVD